MEQLESIATKDIAIAALGGTAAIGSMLLVFVTFIVMKADSLPATQNKRYKSFVRTAKWGLFPLLAQVLVIFTSYFWMFYPSSSSLFYLWSVGFPIAVMAFIIYSAAVMLMIY